MTRTPPAFAGGLLKREVRFVDHWLRRILATKGAPASATLGTSFEFQAGLQFREWDFLPLSTALNHAPERCRSSELQVLTIVTLDAKDHRAGFAGTSYEDTFLLSGVKHALDILSRFGR